MNSENTDNLEINLNQPSSPLVPLNIHNFVKEINIPIEMKIQTNDKENTNTMTGGNATTDNGIFGYFKSFFKGFSQQSHQKKNHDTQNKSYLNSLFYSGNEEKKESETKDVALGEENKNIPQESETKIVPLNQENENIPQESETKDVALGEENKNILQDSETKDVALDQENENIEITKIILTTEDPEMVLRESLKGTKLFHLAERTDLPSQWV